MEEEVKRWFTLALWYVANINNPCYNEWYILQYTWFLYFVILHLKPQPDVQLWAKCLLPGQERGAPLSPGSPSWWPKSELSRPCCLAGTTWSGSGTEGWTELVVCCLYLLSGSKELCMLAFLNESLREEILFICPDRRSIHQKQVPSYRGCSHVKRYSLNLWPRLYLFDILRNGNIT